MVSSLEYWPSNQSGLSPTAFKKEHRECSEVNLSHPDMNNWTKEIMHYDKGWPVAAPIFTVFSPMGHSYKMFTRLVQ